MPESLQRAKKRAKPSRSSREEGELAMTLSRRRFLNTGLSALGFALAAPAVLRGRMVSAAPRSIVPSLPGLDARTTNTFSLSAITGETEFISGVPSRTLGFNRPYLGPIVRVRSGTETAASVENKTDVPVSVHWHGLLVPGDVDGGPHQPIAPGETWRPKLAVDQPPATLWYHTHLHGQTGSRVYAGLAGVMIVDDGNDAERGLPVAADVDDLVLVLQDKRFNAAGQAVYEPGAADLMHGFLGDAILVNGQQASRANVPPGIVRLRLVNAANGRNFNVYFADGRPMALIATDQGFLPNPISIERLRLSPGERVELLVDFADGAATTLMSEPHAETMGMMPMGGMMHGDIPLHETFTAAFPLLDFAVDAALPAAVRSLPTNLDAAAEQIALPSTTRSFVLNDMGMMMGGGMMGGAAAFGINGRPFDMARLDLEANIGTTERWLVGGQMMGHPFHVHGVRFRVALENGRPPRPENSGWKDTVFVEGETELLVRFDHGATAAKPYMIHCHILEHEDAGMMAQFAVT
jgi:FtsP/CotA-like multicopper oxidase with cupredoxin domain